MSDEMELEKKLTDEIDSLESEAFEKIGEMKNVEIPDVADVIVTYDVKNTEEETAFREFQNRYVKKSNIIKTAAFGILAVLFVFQVIKYTDNFVSWLCLAVCLAVIFIVWYNPYKIRKTLMESLKPLEDDRYIFKLYDDRFTIETILPDDEFEEGEEKPKIPPRVVRFDDIGLSVLEKPEMFILFLKKESIYVLPKRCMDEAEILKIAEVFSDKLSDDYSKEAIQEK